MFSFKSIVLVAACVIGVQSSEVAVATPLTVPAHVGYEHAIPDNVPPYASQINVVNRALAAPYAAPFAAPVAAPLAAPVAAPFAAPLAGPIGPVAAPVVAPFARFAGPYTAAPYFAGPAVPYPAPAVAPAPYAAPYPYAAAPSLLRTPYGFAPTFVR